MTKFNDMHRLVVKAHNPRKPILITLAVLVLWLGSMWIAHRQGALGVSTRLPELEKQLRESQRGLSTTQSQFSETKDQAALFQRSEQIARTANESLQNTLRNREDEVANLREDLAFYQRLVGGKAPLQGLNVQEFSLRSIDQKRAYNFSLTLMQNLKKGAQTSGTLDIKVEGVRDGKLVSVNWAELLQQTSSEPLQFSFKYFQRLDGSLMLPEGFTPNRVIINVKSKGGEAAQQAFNFQESIQVGE